MAFAGRLHPLLLHSPIALVIIAAAAELVAILTTFRASHVGYCSIHPRMTGQVVVG
jgi:uncharacterized membrane protein